MSPTKSKPSIYDEISDIPMISPKKGISSPPPKMLAASPPWECEMTWGRELFEAVQASKYDIVARLLQNKGDSSVNDYNPYPRPSNKDWTRKCLEIAVENGDKAIIRALVKEGARLAPVGSDHWKNVLFYVVDEEMTQTAGLLVGRETLNDRNASLLEVVQKGSIRAANLFLGHGAQPSFVGRYDQNALFSAVEQGRHDLVKLLLDYSEDISGKNSRGETVIDIAMMNWDDEMARLLLTHTGRGLLPRLTSVLALDEKLVIQDYQESLKLLEAGCNPMARMQFSMIENREEPIVGMSNEYLKFLCAGIVDIQGTANSERHRGLDTSSDTHFVCAMKWILECLTRHPDCISAERTLPRLPSRVLDIGTAGTPNVQLIETKTQTGRYVALTHRWVGSSITKTTKANLAARLQGIRLSDLTKTMQDAVHITRRLGIRYLWIDALCIIQDSPSDWEDEAGNMAGIYRNSIFTVAAAAAADHSDGCFVSEKKEGKGGELSSRGWILQEELLSPRILKYCYGFIEWDCISRTASSESNSTGWFMKKSQHTAEQALFKRPLWDFHFTDTPLEEQAYLSWQQIVQSYSFRTLTKDSDKLMAIMGIASFVQNVMKDEFFAGLWKGQLFRDLLWVSTESTNTRIEGHNFPTWSWASIKGPISFSNWPGASSPSCNKHMVELSRLDPISDASGGSTSYSIVVKGKLQKVEYGHDNKLLPVQDTLQSVDEHSDPSKGSWSKKRKRNESGPQSDDVSGGHEYSIKNEPTPDIQTGNERKSEKPDHKLQITAVFFPDTRNTTFEHAWVLPIAREHSWIYGLVLLRAAEVDDTVTPSESSRDKYQRVGTCHVDADESFKFFLEKEEQEIEIV